MADATPVALLSKTKETRQSVTLEDANQEEKCGTGMYIVLDGRTYCQLKEKIACRFSTAPTPQRRVRPQLRKHHRIKSPP